MSNTPPSQLNPASAPWHNLLARFSLLDDKADDTTIDESLRAGVELRGATPWILMFAIFIASIGLNVNSTAVIIGAMLISPLMGPIMGIGYGIAIYDFLLIRKSFVNLIIATLISLLASTIYFALSPLTEAHSELLARTSPTIWDVLIALFGGFAGIIGVTRKEKTNVIPGVAIATALMPPLCTAGYGLANGNWAFFMGAFYLFSINCVYIAAAAVLVIGLLNPPHKHFVDPAVETRVKRVLMLVVLLTGLPSLYLAYRLVGNEVFHNKATQFVRQEFTFPKSHVIEIGVTPKNKHVEVTLIGDRLPANTVETIRAHLSASLKGAILTIHQAGDDNIDINTLREGIVKELSGNDLAMAARDQQIADLRRQITWSAQSKQLTAELQAQYPGLTDIIIGEGATKAATENAADSSASSSSQADTASPVPLLVAHSEKRLSRSETERIENWFRARTQSDAARVAIN